MSATILTDEQIVGFAYKRDGQPEITLMRLFARDVEQAALQSPEVQAWKRDAERYRFCRSQRSPAEIHIHGVELGLAGETLDEAIDAEMKEWKI